MIPKPNVPVKPGDFVGRELQIDAFRSILQQGVETGTTSSVAVLGDWGIGKSSLLLKFNATCSESDYRMLPVFFSVSSDLGDYLRLAQSLIDKLAETLATWSSLAARIRSEVQKWRLRRASLAGFQFDREASPFFLSSGSALLRHTLADLWERFLRPAHINGAIFFLDDLHNFAARNPEDIALALRDQFQSFAIEGMNYSVCFSARSNYFAGIRSFAEPAVRFYDKFYLEPFTFEETKEYIEAVFGSDFDRRHELGPWLYKKTQGHPYFLAFITRQLLTLAPDNFPKRPADLWPEIFRHLEREKFRSDLEQLSEKDSELLRAFARGDGEEFGPTQIGQQFERVYFRRLTDKGLLIRTGRGRYKVYHPLFKLFLQGLKP